VAFLDKFATAPGALSPDRVESVIENLNEVLNTRQGYGWFRPDFGMGDASAATTRVKIAEEFMRDVRENIERYEPRVRLKDIVSVAVDDPLRLAFTLRCTLLGDARALHLEFDTVLKSVSIGEAS
jgi:type VI secretion system protein